MILSIILILGFGLIASKIFSWFKLPGLLGMIFIGVALGPYGFNFLDKSILDNSTDIRMIALVIILLRAGLGLKKDALNKVGKIAIKMSGIPCLMEGLAIMGVAHLLFKIPIVEAGILGFVVAAVSPAVVVPFMLRLKDKDLGMNKGIPVIILAGASVDDVFAITMFTAFLGLSMGTGQNIIFQILQIPLQVIGGILLGLISGYILYKLYGIKRIKLSDMEKITAVISIALLVLLIGERFQIAGLLGVMTLGFILLERVNDIAIILENQLNKIWFFAQVFLFVLIGAEVNLQVAWKAGLIGLVVILIGLLSRSIGVIIALHGSNLNIKEKLFCTIAYIPKATVQAAIGGIPLAMGIASGSIILAVAVLAIIITAPLGAVGIKVFAPILLQQGENSK